MDYEKWASDGEVHKGPQEVVLGNFRRKENGRRLMIFRKRSVTVKVSSDWESQWKKLLAECER